MTCFKFCLTVFLCVFIVSCQHPYTNNKTILQAESVLFTSPDSASRLLTTISHPEKLSMPDYAAWCLIYTHTQIRLRKEIKSESLIMISVKYYNKSKLTKQCGTANYLLGCILKSQHKNKAAMEAYKLAEDKLENTNENKIKGLIDFNIGSIYKQDELYNQSLNYFKKSLRYFILSKDLSFQAYSYREISDVCFELDYPLKSVLHYSNLALNLSKEAGDSLNYYTTLTRKGEFLYNKDYYLAKKYILEGYRFFPDQRSYYSAILSYIYSKTNKLDSAKYYLKLSFGDTLYTKSKPIKYLGGAYVAKGENNYKQAFDYLEKAYLIRDSVFQQKIHSQIYRIDKQYDKTKEQAENATLKIDNQFNVIVIGILIIMVMAAMIIYLIASDRHKKKLIENRIKNQKMEYTILLKEAENNQKRELLLTKLQTRMENTLQLNRLKLGLSQHEKLEDFIKGISIQAILSETDWEYYIQEVNDIFDKKISDLSTSNPKLTQPDIKVITLIFLKMDISDCCSLLNMTKNAMYHRRNIIKERIGISKEIELEDWVRRITNGNLTEKL